jgi:hypothetical protein
MSTIDFDSRRQVEGFSRLISGFVPKPGPGIHAGPDFRGDSSVGMTGEWWREQPDEDRCVVWETLPVSEAVDSTFSFVGDSANLPENAFPASQATLTVNDTNVLTFDLGQRLPCRWDEGEWALDFTPRQIRSTGDSNDRQMNAGGCSGIYRLAVPGSALEPGKPLELGVTVAPPRAGRPTWFAIRERTDVIELTLETNREEIRQLQREVMHLKRIVGSLSRTVHSNLLPERIETENVIVYESGTKHVHEADVLRLQNGDMMVALREASEHISCDGKIVTVRSTDDGKTWGDRQVLREHPHTDERSGSIAQLRNGVVISNHLANTCYDGSGRFVGETNNSYKGRPAGIYIGRSTDNGHSWTWNESPMVSEPYLLSFTAERIIEDPSGRLFMACYVSNVDGYKSDTASILFCSEDGGDEWRYLSTIGDIEGVGLAEPALVVTSTGRLISIMRNDVGDQFFQAISDDAGDSWSPAKPCGIPGRGNPASLLTLEDGTVLCVHGARQDPAGMYVVASKDDGVTWDLDGRRIIRDDFSNWDCCYPSTVLMPDGRIFTTFYFNMFERFFILGSFFEWR